MSLELNLKGKVGQSLTREGLSDQGMWCEQEQGRALQLQGRIIPALCSGEGCRGGKAPLMSSVQA